MQEVYGEVLALNNTAYKPIYEGLARVFGPHLALPQHYKTMPIPEALEEVSSGMTSFFFRGKENKRQLVPDYVGQPKIT